MVQEDVDFFACVKIYYTGSNDPIGLFWMISTSSQKIISKFAWLEFGQKWTNFKQLASPRYHDKLKNTTRQIAQFYQHFVLNIFLFVKTNSFDSLRLLQIFNQFMKFLSNIRPWKRIQNSNLVCSNTYITHSNSFMPVITKDMTRIARAFREGWVEGNRVRKYKGGINIAPVNCAPLYKLRLGCGGKWRDKGSDRGTFLLLPPPPPLAALLMIRQVGVCRKQRLHRRNSHAPAYVIKKSNMTFHQCTHWSLYIWWRLTREPFTVLHVHG